MSYPAENDPYRRFFNRTVQSQQPGSSSLGRSQCQSQIQMVSDRQSQSQFQMSNVSSYGIQSPSLFGYQSRFRIQTPRFRSRSVKEIGTQTSPKHMVVAGQAISNLINEIKASY